MIKIRYEELKVEIDVRVETFIIIMQIGEEMINNEYYVKLEVFF